MTEILSGLISQSQLRRTTKAYQQCLQVCKFTLMVHSLYEKVLSRGPNEMDQRLMNRNHVYLYIAIDVLVQKHGQYIECAVATC